METALALCRLAHFLAAMVAFGTSAFLWRFAPVGARRELAASLWRIVFVASLILTFSAIVWIALESSAMADDWSAALDADTLQSVLFDTAFGRLFQARLVFCAALAAWLAFHKGDHWAVSTGLAALVLASLGLAGHAAMQTGTLGALHRANDALHLLCGGAWLGGLPPFVLCLGLAERPELRDEAILAMSRYSRYGHFFVALLLISGAANVAMTTGALPLPPTTPYRALLAAKVVLAITMVSIAIFNRYVIVPRIQPRAAISPALLRGSVAEVGLSVVIVALVSLFGLLDPS